MIQSLHTIPYEIHKVSSESELYKSSNILVNNPSDPLSRWSSTTNDNHQYIIIKLRGPSIITSIKFGKFSKIHVCNIKHLSIFSYNITEKKCKEKDHIETAYFSVLERCEGCGHNMVNMGGRERCLNRCCVGCVPYTNTEESPVCIYKGGLHNDTVPEILPMRFVDENLFVVSRYVMICPEQAWGVNFNFSIWHVEVYGYYLEEKVFYRCKSFCGENNDKDIANGKDLGNINKDLINNYYDNNKDKLNNNEEDNLRINEHDNVDNIDYNGQSNINNINEDDKYNINEYDNVNNIDGNNDNNNGQSYNNNINEDGNNSKDQSNINNEIDNNNKYDNNNKDQSNIKNNKDKTRTMTDLERFKGLETSGHIIIFALNWNNHIISEKCNYSILKYLNFQNIFSTYSNTIKHFKTEAKISNNNALILQLKEYISKENFIELENKLITCLINGYFELKRENKMEWRKIKNFNEQSKFEYKYNCDLLNLYEDNRNLFESGKRNYKNHEIACDGLNKEPKYMVNRVNKFKYVDGDVEWPVERGGHAIASGGRYLYVHGGWDGSKECSDLCVFDCVNETWKIENLDFNARSCHQMIYVEDIDALLRTDFNDRNNSYSIVESNNNTGSNSILNNEDINLENNSILNNGVINLENNSILNNEDINLENNSILNNDDINIENNSILNNEDINLENNSILNNEDINTDVVHDDISIQNKKIEDNESSNKKVNAGLLFIGHYDNSETKKYSSEILIQRLNSTETETFNLFDKSITGIYDTQCTKNENEIYIFGGKYRINKEVIFKYSGLYHIKQGVLAQIKDDGTNGSVIGGRSGHNLIYFENKYNQKIGLPCKCNTNDTYENINTPNNITEIGLPSKCNTNDTYQNINTPNNIKEISLPCKCNTNDTYENINTPNNITEIGLPSKCNANDKYQNMNIPNNITEIGLPSKCNTNDTYQNINTPNNIKEISLPCKCNTNDTHQNMNTTDNNKSFHIKKKLGYNQNINETLLKIVYPKRNLFIIGGQKDKIYLNEIKVYDIDRQHVWKIIEFPIKTENRILTRSVLVDEEIYVLFSHESIKNNGYDKMELYVYSIYKDKWNNIEFKGEKPKPRSAHTFTYNKCANTIYLFGGTIYYNTIKSSKLKDEKKCDSKHKQCGEGWEYSNEQDNINEYDCLFNAKNDGESEENNEPLVYLEDNDEYQLCFDSEDSQNKIGEIANNNMSNDTNRTSINNEDEDLTRNKSKPIGKKVNDLWKIKLCNDVTKIKKIKFVVRKHKFMRMVSKGNLKGALEYIKKNVYPLFDHKDENESRKYKELCYEIYKDNPFVDDQSIFNDIMDLFVDEKIQNIKNLWE